MKDQNLACFYDMDGTIVDNNNMITLAWQEAQQLLQNKYTDFPVFDEDIIKKLMGQPGPALVAAPELNIPEKYHQELLDTFITKITEKYHRLTLYPDLKETLKKLKQRNVKLALITGASQEAAVEITERFSIKDYFEVLVGGNTTERGKPHADPVLYAIQHLKIKHLNKNRIFFIGDSINDIRAAKAAGITSVFFSPQKSHSNEDVLRQEADLTIEKHVDIFNIINSDL